MPDINIICPHCQGVTVASEFVDRSQLKCKNCGKNVQESTETPIPPPTAAAGQSKLRTRKNVYIQPEDPSSGPEGATLGWEDTREKARAATPPERRKTGHATKAWLLFILLGGLAWVFRYSPLPELTPYRAMMEPFEPILGMGLHVAIILMAFKDTVFSGVLCLLIPGYSLYYIFTVSDQFMVRSVSAALLVWIGENCAIFYTQKMNDGIAFINDWIARGGS